MPCGVRNPTKMTRISIQLDERLEQMAEELSIELNRRVSKSEVSMLAARQLENKTLPIVKKRGRKEISFSSFAHL